MKDKEAKSVTKQLTRYAKVGGVVGKLATKLAIKCRLLGQYQLYGAILKEQKLAVVCKPVDEVTTDGYQ